MNDEERENILLDLFIQPGWKLLMEEMTEAHFVLVETAWTVKDEKTLYQRKGEIQKLSELLSFEAFTKAQAEDAETI